ncbi:Cytochrome P450 [Vigna angularis]|uniref:Cytochrome P450 n=1 Tax=Phaseolus angularis TaxID=3914 RepID=A0A8T0JSD2_PHAAN|nr:Cytochrome P450 [Vigna angularis]
MKGVSGRRRAEGLRKPLGYVGVRSLSKHELEENYRKSFNASFILHTLEILSNHHLNSFPRIRKDETIRLLHKLVDASNKDDFTKVELRPLFADLTFNTVMRMVCGKRYYGVEEHDGTNAEEARKFREVMDELTQFGLGSNLGDFVPFVQIVQF